MAEMEVGVHVLEKATDGAQSLGRAGTSEACKEILPSLFCEWTNPVARTY
jgi:hypothetical protein